MPKINLLSRKEKQPVKTSYDEAKLLRREFYNSKGWRDLSLYVKKTQPCCAECLKRGVVRAADSVHHKISPFKGGKINWELGLDINNLEPICSKCHAEEHQRLKNKKYMTQEEIISQLDDLFNENITDEEIELKYDSQSGSGKTL